MEDVVEVVEVPAFITLTLGFIVFFLGAFLTRNLSFLRNFSIPEPVSGGLAVALLVWASFAWLNVEFDFDLDTRDELLVVFFTTLGLNARLADLRKGGLLLIILLVMTVGFIFVQNLIGVGAAILFDLPTPVGVMVGSAALIGGHGTAIAWSPIISEMTGIAAIGEVAIAAATLGLVIAVLVGGPVGEFLINRFKLKPEEAVSPVVGLSYEQQEQGEAVINHVSLMRVLLAANVAIIIGYFANEVVVDWGLKLPLFVTCLMAGILLSNTIPFLFPKLPWPARTRALAVVSDYSLSLFLAMSLMSMELWTLVELGGPLLLILAVQCLVTVVLVVFVFFPLLGRNYLAAVLSGGFVGFTLGATPSAIANMSAVTKRYGPAPIAFLVLPLVSAFFVDLANALIIQFFVGL